MSAPGNHPEHTLSTKSWIFKKTYMFFGTLMFDLLLSVAFAQADPLKIISTHQESFNNLDCAHDSSCDLKSFSLIYQDYSIDLSDQGFRGLNYGTRMYAGYTTTTPAQLFEFGIVQFIHGCQYKSHLSNGKVVEDLTTLRDFYGKKVVFHHPQWVIDGVVSDPLDWNFEVDPKSRHSAYQWSPSGGGMMATDAQYVSLIEPTNPSLFVSDRPGSVSYSLSSKIADNISLEFSTCVYRTRDVPIDVPYDQIEFAQPLKCFSWTSSWIYNFEKNRFERPSGLRPICLTSAPPSVQH